MRGGDALTGDATSLYDGWRLGRDCGALTVDHAGGYSPYGYCGAASPNPAATRRLRGHPDFDCRVRPLTCQTAWFRPAALKSYHHTLKACHSLTIMATSKGTKRVTEAALDVNNWNTLERLILSQALYEFGVDKLVQVAALMSSHPMLPRPKNFFTIKVSD